MERAKHEIVGAYKASKQKYICDGITYNREDWKQKEFNRLYPNSLFSNYREMSYHFDLNKDPVMDLNLRSFKWK